MNLKSLVLIILLLLAARAGEAATYTVLNTNDSGFGSLRQAIINSNSTPGIDDTIEFNIAGAGVRSIVLLSDLPVIQGNVTIDGTTQPGYAGAPLIEINAAAATSGLRFVTAGTVVVRGLIVNRAASHGIDISNGPSAIDITITACYIGTNSTGAGAAGNGGDGIHFGGFGTNASSLTIGGLTAAERNVISGNAGDGINLSGNGTVLVYNNYIGTNAAGTIDLGNGGDGIDAAVSTVAIGGTNNALSLGLGNVISGNNGNGLLLDGSGTISVQRNLIGTNAAGTGDIGNSQNGIEIDGGSPLIGSSTNALNGNVISGNGGDVANGHGIALRYYASGAQIFGNRIGTNAAGNGALQNDADGIFLDGVANNQIGLAGNATARNTIGGNFLHGIVISGAGATGNAIENNLIGTNASGANLGNGGDGVLLTGVSTPVAGANKIGGATAGAGNTIAFNRNGHGVEIAAAWTGNTIHNNSIFQNLGNGVNVGVAGAVDNSIRFNAIYSNAGLGINLGPSGVTPNDANDTDLGANNLQNFPVLQGVTPTRIAGTLNSGANQTFTLDFYRVDSCDPSGSGPGRYYLTSTDVTTAGSNASFNFAFAGLAVGQIVTATATDASGNTSEFSPCRTVAAAGEFQFTTAAQTVAENVVSTLVTVNRVNGAQGAVTVDYATVDGTAVAGQDFGAASGTLTFLNGEVSKSFVVIILNDPTDEPDETFTVALSNPTNGALLTAPSTETITITDNDGPPSASISDVALREGNSGTTGFNFTVSLVRASAFPVTVDYATADGTANAGIDYAATTGTVTFAPGETTKPATVPVTGELTVEIDETFFVNLANPTNATIADGQGIGTILDDDNPGRLQFAASPYTVAEGGGALLTVTRTNGDAGTVAVDYFTTGGTATPTVDYQPAAGTLTFLNGETSKTIPVTALQDAQVEPTESFNVVLANPVGGASLGALPATTVNILDDDAGALLSIGGRILKTDSTPLAGATVNLQGAQTGTATTDANGDFVFNNLAPNGSFTVTPAALGYTFNPLARSYPNLTANVTNANFTATAAPTRQLRAVGGDAAPGSPVAVTVELVAQGDENAVGFTLDYDAIVLSNPTVVLNPDAAAAVLTVNSAAAGHLGIVLSLPAGQSFTAGTKSLVTATFNTTPNALYSSAVTFGDTPVLRQIVNANADPLPASYVNGQVTFAQGFEADVAPRPTGSGNGTVTVADFTQVGRFVAGLDTPNASFNEFQRTDSAPRVSKGNGVVSVADYTQAGRFAAGLDVVQTAGGQTAPGFLAGPVPFDEKAAAPGFAPTLVRVVTTPAVPGTQVTVVIETVANGDENGFGFSLNYDPAKLSNPTVARGADTQTATLIPNTTQAGRVGVVLGMPFGQGIAAGVRQLVTVRFDVAANAPAGPSPLVTGDLPVFREVADVNGSAVPATFQDGAVNISVATAAGVAVGGRVLTSAGTGLAQASVTLTDANGAARSALTNSFGAFRFDDVPAGAVYTLEVRHKTSRFAPRVLTVTDELTDLTVVAEDGN
ncbi:MAG: carboxypeptidase regulatory-like domain-containing protein [Acidobacteria bacterium]|nr:carboxypeptidase regulatory-like domain-containing protein [Acidobacteriota bacterium]